MKDNGYKVLVLGTSNAIYKDGYVAKLANHPRIALLENRSLGASSCLSAAYLGSYIDFSAYDFCILEFMTSENIHLDIDTVRSETVYNMLLQVSSDAAKAGCIPIHLMLPSEWVDRERTPYRDLSEKLHEVCSMPFLDVYNLTRTLKAIAGPEADSWFFMDEMHLSFPYCAHVAQIVGDNLDAIWAGKSSGIVVCSESPEYRFYPAVGTLHYNEGIISHYKTSIIEIEAVELNIGRMAVFDIDAVSVVGFVCNHSMTFSAMRFISAEVKDYSFVTEHIGAPKTIVTARPLYNSAPILNGRFILTAVSDRDHGISERFRTYDDRGLIAANGQNGFSIVGFICDTQIVTPRYKIRSTPYNIGETIGEARLGVIAGEARASSV